MAGLRLRLACDKAFFDGGFALRMRVNHVSWVLIASHTSFRLDACARWANSSVTTCDQGENVLAFLSTPNSRASLGTK